MNIAEPLLAAIEEFNKFPGIGRKTAQRLALFLLKRNEHEVKNFVNSILDLKSKLHFCSDCFNLATEDKCEVCLSPKRDRSIICVVEEVSDVISIEKSNEFNGLYHVLGGVLNPLSGVHQDDLKIKELIKRASNGETKELILAVNPDTEGETTSLYIAKNVKHLGIKVTRIARGIPIGGDLEFADEATVGRAVLGRIEI